MPLVPMRLLLDHAAENGYGLAAFNVNNMEQIQAIMEAAKETNSPVIVQASRGARSYSQDNYLKHLMLAAAELYPQLPICMHQDHGNSPATCKSAIDNNFHVRIDRGVWGVATWEDIDPNIDFFSIYVGGLTNAYQWTDPRGRLQAGRPPGTGRQFAHKTLQLNFWRPGDESEPERAGNPLRRRPRAGPTSTTSSEGVAYRWVYR